MLGSLKKGHRDTWVYKETVVKPEKNPKQLSTRKGSLKCSSMTQLFMAGDPAVSNQYKKETNMLDFARQLQTKPPHPPSHPAESAEILALFQSPELEQNLSTPPYEKIMFTASH